MREKKQRILLAILILTGVVVPVLFMVRQFSKAPLSLRAEDIGLNYAALLVAIVVLVTLAEFGFRLRAVLALVGAGVVHFYLSHRIDSLGFAGPGAMRMIAILAIIDLGGLLALTFVLPSPSLDLLAAEFRKAWRRSLWVLAVVGALVLVVFACRFALMESDQLPSVLELQQRIYVLSISIVCVFLFKHLLPGAVNMLYGTYLEEQLRSSREVGPPGPPAHPFDT